MILPFPISVNTAYATDWETKRRFRTKAYGEWCKAAKESLKTQQVPEWCNGAVRLDLELVKPRNKDGSFTKRRMDLSNFVKVVEDFLVDMKIIEDDSLIYHLRVRWIDEDFKGCRVTITELN
jgi:Holliday junction resolvase RusA-like endonuclease